MILFRAIFWVAVAIILIPRDPNLGIAVPQAASAACQPGDCQFTGPAALRDALLFRLYQVKADLAAKDARLASVSN